MAEGVPDRRSVMRKEEGTGKVVLSKPGGIDRLFIVDGRYRPFRAFPRFPEAFNPFLGPLPPSPVNTTPLHRIPAVYEKSISPQSRRDHSNDD